MLEQVMVMTESPAILKPLLKAAMQNEARQLAHGIKRTKERLTMFEKQFGMSSDEFKQRFEVGEINETLDIIDWLMEIEALRLLNEQYQALKHARFN
ncbi:MAG: hypothetical protein NT169_04755 [Chloroflexi bacterium]|nr:hypothetical protein [Chloroflexota bacterium]